MDWFRNLFSNCASSQYGDVLQNAGQTQYINNEETEPKKERIYYTVGNCGPDTALVIDTEYTKVTLTMSEAGTRHLIKLLEASILHQGDQE